MDLQAYQLQKLEFEKQQPNYRQLCETCIQPSFACYCEHVQRFDAKIKFVVLIHPIEAKRRIATGRMAHLCLEKSELITGQDYSKNERVNAILQNPLNQPFILYPGAQSMNLSELPKDRFLGEKNSLIHEGKQPVLFVIDGTWATARKTMRQSENLKQIPRLCFTPPGPSRFRVRKQPASHCYSTIEAIHHSIELLSRSVGFNCEQREHDKLLYVFDKMVERQLDFIRESYANPKPSQYRRPRHKKVPTEFVEDLTSPVPL